MRTSPTTNRCAAIALAFSLIFCAGCKQAEPKPEASDARTRVTCSIAPLTFAVKAIGGDRVSVNTLLTPGQSPATYEPTAKQMVALSQSKCLFAVGVPFEKQVVASIADSMPNLKVIDSAAGISKRGAPSQCDHDHEGHGHDGHNHEGHDHAHEQVLDPHIWMSPRVMRSVARNVHRTLAELDPEGREEYARRLAELQKTLGQLDSKIAASLSNLQTKAFYVYHPSLGYFADAYGLEQIAIEQGGKDPTAKDLDALVKRAKAEGVKLIFVQPQFSQRAAQSVAERIGGSAVVLDPLAENYVENLEHVAEQISTALRPKDSVSVTEEQPDE